MATIRVIYEAEPDFPAHPDAVRYQVGDYWVDAIGAPAGELDGALEGLGRVLYRERREARAALARDLSDRLKKPR